MLFLHVAALCFCFSTVRASIFASGIVSLECLQCICMQESGCQHNGCNLDGLEVVCSYFQINKNYWLDCNTPGNSWQECAFDLHCASQCVQNYMQLHASRDNCPMTCEGFAREHNGGLRGCHDTNTLSYWRALQSQPGCGNL